MDDPAPVEPEGTRTLDIRIAEPKELHAYQGDHAMRVEQARADCAAFLGRTLGWEGASAGG